MYYSRQIEITAGGGGKVKINIEENNRGNHGNIFITAGGGGKVKINIEENNRGNSGNIFITAGK